MLSTGITDVKMRADVYDGLKKNKKKPPLIMKKLTVH